MRRRAGAPIRLAMATVVLVVIYLLTTDYQRSVLDAAMIYAIAAIALTVLMGWAGQASLLSAGLLLAGGYSAVLCANQLHLPFPLPILLPIPIGYAFGALAALPARRLGGIYLLLSTLALFYVITNVGNIVQTHQNAITGYFLKPPSLFGFVIDSATRWYPVCGVALFLVYEYFRYLRTTRVGRAWILIKESPDAARVAGIRSNSYISVAFSTTTAAHFLSGALLVYFLGSVSYDSVSLLDSVNFIVMIVLGGMGSLVGAIVGAVILTAIPSFMNTAFGSGDASGFVSRHLLALEQIVFALIGIAVLLGVHRRLLAAVRRARRRNLQATAGAESGSAALAGPGSDAKSPAQLLRIEGVSVNYAAGERAVTNASFSLVDHSATALVGRNGAGKSSLLYAVVGFPPGSEGRVTTGDVHWYARDRAPQNLGGVSAIRRCALGIVFVPAEGKVFDDLTVAQHLREGIAAGAGRPTQVGSGGRGLSEEDLFGAFPALRLRLQSRAGLLSGGERQQLAIAVALARSAQLVVVDEASLGLAPVAVGALTPILQRLSREFARGLLIAEQNPTLAMTAADNVLLMDDGAIKERGSADPEFMKLIEESYLGGHRLVKP